MPEHTIQLPAFLIDAHLSPGLRKELSDDSPPGPKTFVFDWSNVRFFDDYTLLKLIFVQRHLRSVGNRVRNNGFGLRGADLNGQAVLRQVWAVGLPELTASGHLIGNDQLKQALDDERELLESDPLGGLQSPAASTAVIPILCCHDRKHFAAGSREEKHLDLFIKICLRPADTSLAWDLVESRTFRHLMLQQLRRNVHEHAREGNAAIGLAILRVWTTGSLSDEWSLTGDMRAQLLRAWDQEPVPSVLSGLGSHRAVLQMSVLDDGIGIPKKLKIVHDRLRSSVIQQELFPHNEHLHYSSGDFNTRFADPASWPDEKARLIAFATDILGTSKTDRAPEVKGLQYLREHAVLEMGGKMGIESDGAGVSDFTRDRPYGQLRRLRLWWPDSGGTGICVAVPMTAVHTPDPVSDVIPHPADIRASGDTGSVAQRVKVKDRLQSSELKPKDLEACAQELITVIALPEAEDDVSQLRRQGLVIIDWGELPESKTVFHYLLAEIARTLAKTDTRALRPFVFVNLPKGLCALLGNAITEFSRGDRPTPVLAFTAEHREPFWLGLGNENLIPEELRHKIPVALQRTLTDHKENRTEALCRDCLNRLLEALGPLSLTDRSILHTVPYQSTKAIRQSQLLLRLTLLTRRCALFREERLRPFGSDETHDTGRFRPVFNWCEIDAEVRKLFLDEFRDVFTTPPVCFVPPQNLGVRLPHSKRVSARYFRSDALVDSRIALELSQHLTALALSIANQTREKRIDWVVTCTSPLHWFVHKIVDGLAERGLHCSHHVFSSYEAIPSAVGGVGMRRNDIVVAFTDVIASGHTAYRMAESLVNQFDVRMVGLIALADIRTPEDRRTGPSLDRIYGGTILCLYNEPEPDRQDLTPTYYVHAETVVPKHLARIRRTDDAIETIYSGVGPLAEHHSYFASVKPSLDLMTSVGAVQMGHFQHGSHHSEIFVDVEKIFSYREYRNLIVTALFRYIIANEIRLVIYPSHSSAYLLADELKQRFGSDSSAVDFLMACRTFRGSQGTNYALTRFSPDADPEWRRFSTAAVLILDDAVCSGSTVKSIIGELARIDRNYYESQTHLASPEYAANFSVHVVAFLNRLSRVSSHFWAGLSQVTGRRIQFSALVSIPVAADPAELCPQCRLGKRLQHARESSAYCFYAKEFLSWWISRIVVVLSHDRRQDESRHVRRFSSEEVVRIAAYISAMERSTYSYICDRLVPTPETSESAAVCIHVRGRAGFLGNQFPSASKSQNSVTELCNELGYLIDMTVDKDGQLVSEEGALEVLRTLTHRYLQVRPSTDEVERVMECLFSKLAGAFGDRLVLGGVTAVLDSCLKSFEPPEYSEDDWRHLREAVRTKLRGVSRAGIPERAALMINWCDTYLGEGGKNIDSVGSAVRMLAEYAKRGRSYHFYGRHELDELYEMLNAPAGESRADEDEETVTRVRACTGCFSDLVRATQVLRSVSGLDERRLKYLQAKTERNVQVLRGICNALESHGIGVEEVRGQLARLRTVFSQTYTFWYPEDGQPVPGSVIGRFTPNLVQALGAAGSGFTPRNRPKDCMNIEFSYASRHTDIKVVVDPAVLATALHQLLDNVDRLADRDSRVRVLCETRLPEDESGPQRGTADVASGHVQVAVSNTGTLPPADLATVKLRGLSDVKTRLVEYGGNLSFGDPAPGWSFTVTMILRVWTEVDNDSVLSRG